MAMRSSLLLRGHFLTRNVLSFQKSSRPFSLSCPALSNQGGDVDKEVTHTGQKFDKEDYRMVRFIDKKKMVNKQFAIDLIAEVPPAEEKSRVVSCDGGGGPLGHPKVYINLDQPGNHSCGYCGLRFTKKDLH